MNIGEVNKGAVVLILVLLLGAGGYLWYSQMYKPAVALKVTAVAATSTAEQGLAAANTELAAAQQRLDDAKKENFDPDDSIARLAKARSGVPVDKLYDDAAIVLRDMAQRSGVDTRLKAGTEAGDATSNSAGAAAPLSKLQGATPIDLQFDAAGTYEEMLAFMRLVEEPVEMADGKLYTRGRLFNVVSLRIGDDPDATTSSNSAGGGQDDSEQDVNALEVGPKDVLFKVIIRMYTSSSENASNVGTGTPDPAAAGTPAGDAGSTTPGTDGTVPESGADPAAGGVTPPAGGVDPAAAGGTTPSVDGTTPSVDGTTPSGGTPGATDGSATGAGTTPTPVPAGASTGVS